jgi:hypothetical protein
LAPRHRIRNGALSSVRGGARSLVRRHQLLRANGFSLQATAKTLEGKQHPDRDAQFRYINEQVRQFQVADEPVISVDSKKKEMLGQLPSAGREWE